MLKSSLQVSETSEINTQDDFWDFFDVLVGNLFQTQWYNGKASVIDNLLSPRDQRDFAGIY